MKKVILFLVVVFLMGCGSDNSKSKFEGVRSNNNYVEQGMTYLSKSDIPKAIKSFDKAIKADPMNPENYIVLGQVYLRLQNFNRAVDSFSAAVKVASNNGAAYYMLAESQMMAGQKGEALKSIQRSISLFKQQKDEQKFKNALILLRNITETGKVSSVTPEKKESGANE